MTLVISQVFPGKGKGKKNEILEVKVESKEGLCRGIRRFQRRKQNIYGFGSSKELKAHQSCELCSLMKPINTPPVDPLNKPLNHFV